MRRVELEAMIRAVPADKVLDQIIQFDRYADLAPHVQSTTVHRAAATGTGRSGWELHFRSGLLRWTETEQVHRDRLRVDFDQESGDFEQFSGYWQLRQEGPDVALRFEADFDFGIASLEGILDPIAERVITETVAWVLVGMFHDVHLSKHIELVPSRSADRP